MHGRPPTWRAAVKWIGSPGLAGIVEIKEPELSHAFLTLLVVMLSLPLVTGCRQGDGDCEEHVLVGPYYVYNAEDLEVLSGVTTITAGGEEIGALIISSSNLTDLTGLECLRVINGHLDISDNPALTSLKGLGVTTVTNWVAITDNPALTSLEGLDSLSSVGDEDGRTGSLQIYSNGIANLRGLGTLTKVRRLAIGGEPISSLEGLNPQLEPIRDLQISGTAITNLEGLEGIDSIELGLTLRDNLSLTSLSGLSPQGSLGSIDIDGNTSLVSLDGLEGITTVRNELSVSSNDALESIEGLSGISGYVRELYVYTNPALSSLSGLGGFESVGNLSVWRNDALTDLDGLSGLTSVEVALGISENPNLPTCEAEDFLTQLDSLPDNVNISGNDDTGTCE